MSYSIMKYGKISTRTNYKAKGSCHFTIQTNRKIEQIVYLRTKKEYMPSHWSTSVNKWSYFSQSI